MTVPPSYVGAKNRTASNRDDWYSTDGLAHKMKAASLLWSRCISAHQTEKAKLFGPLHAGSGIFVVTNVFDAGLAKIFAGLGFDTAATSSGGFAATLEQRDGRITRVEALSHARTVVEPTDLPTSADLSLRPSTQKDFSLYLGSAISRF